MLWLLGPVHTSNNVEATLSNATSRTILSTKSNVTSTLLPFLATEISSFRQRLNKLNMFNFFRLCRKDEISRKTHSTLLPKTATMSMQQLTFNFVERTIFYDKLVRHRCCFWQQRRMLLRRSRTLLRHCCWCGPRFRKNGQIYVYTVSSLYQLLCIAHV